ITAEATGNISYRKKSKNKLSKKKSVIPPPTTEDEPNAVPKGFENVNLNSNDRQSMAQRCIDLNLLVRKIVKQTVMTICYGVTFIGARDQIINHAKDHLE